jgi:hypothetical protein
LSLFVTGALVISNYEDRLPNESKTAKSREPSWRRDGEKSLDNLLDCGDVNYF